MLVKPVLLKRNSYKLVEVWSILLRAKVLTGGTTNNFVALDSDSQGGTSKKINEANILMPSYRFCGITKLINSKHEVIWRLFINKSINPSFLISCRPGWASPEFTSVEKEENPDTILYSTVVISGGLMYVHTRDLEIPYTRSLKGTPSTE